MIHNSTTIVSEIRFALLAFLVNGPVATDFLSRRVYEAFSSFVQDHKWLMAVIEREAIDLMAAGYIAAVDSTLTLRKNGQALVNACDALHQKIVRESGAEQVS